MDRDCPRLEATLWRYSRRVPSDVKAFLTYHDAHITKNNGFHLVSLLPPSVLKSPIHITVYRTIVSNLISLHTNLDILLTVAILLNVYS